MSRIALVGIGDAGKHHARALASVEREGSVSFSAIVARDPAKDAAFRAELGLSATIPRYESLDALLEADACDAVVLATPDGLHVAQAIACLSRGLAVLVEKPLAPTLAEAEMIVAVARREDRTLVVGYHLRHHAGHALVRRDLETLIGTPRTIHVRWAWPDPAVDGWRARGDGARFWSVAALGTHGVDLALWLAGGGPSAQPPTDVRALLWPRDGIDHAAEISFEPAEGVLAHVSASVRHRAMSRLVVTGTKGEIETLGTLGARGDGEVFVRVGRDAPRPLAFDVESPYTRQTRAFAIAVATKRGFVDDGALLANAHVLDAIASSARSSPASSPSPLPSPKEPRS